MKKFGYKSVMEVPRIEKITLNMGVGEAVADKKVMDHAVGDMQKIAGQKPVVTKSKKSIAGFKIRENYPVGCKVTLRGERMYEFLDRLVTVAIPRVRDFRGISGKSFDGRGNYNMGVKEQIIFPEIEYDKIDALRGMNITHHDHGEDRRRSQGAAVGIQIPIQELRAIWLRLLLINREQKRRDTVAKYAAKRAELKAIVDQYVVERRRALCGASKTASIAAQFQPDTFAQPLRDDRSSARHVPQVRSGAHKIA